MTNDGKSPNRGVEYNIKITQRKQKDNIIEMDSSSLSSSGVVTPGEIMPSSLVEESQLGEAEPQVASGAIAHSTPQQDLITEDEVRVAMLQLYKNDNQRYKLKLRLNLTDDSSVDFIANLTTDRRNFKKYLPEGCEEWFVDWSDTNAKEIKDHYGVKPYRGKFHVSQPFKPGVKVMTQIEPWSQCLVWYNPVDKVWMTCVQTYQFSLIRELSEEGITPAQLKNNLHRHDIWRNPKYDDRQRPKTWAQLRAEKRAGK
jgi:hypothetical protein